MGLYGLLNLALGVVDIWYGWRMLGQHARLAREGGSPTGPWRSVGYSALIGLGVLFILLALVQFRAALIPSA